jgi:glucosamine 6-phosphate synthetase-like amidotransferase/phosphosugar isomerase protein
MCGIIGSFIKPNANKIKESNQLIINQFENQHDRGTEGFGIIRIKKGTIEGIDRACTDTKFLLDLYYNKAESIIAHHRTPTSTRNKIAQTHPIIIKNKELKYDYYIMHNGIIRNDTELKEIHEKAGYKYITEVKEESLYSHYRTGYSTEIIKWNDSESMAIDLVRFIENKQKELKIEGSAAFIAIQKKKDSKEINRIFFGKRNNPLNLLKEKDYIFISSEGEGEKIESDILFSFNPKKLNTNNNFIIKERKMKFEIDRKEEKERKEKEKETEKTRINNTYMPLKRLPNDEKSDWHDNWRYNREYLIAKEEEKEEQKEQKEKEQEISTIKQEYEILLHDLDTEYWISAKENKKTEKNEERLEIAIEERITLIESILDYYNEIMKQDNFEPQKFKKEKSLTISTIAKIISSLELINYYENSLTYENSQEKKQEKEEKINNNIKKQETKKHQYDYYQQHNARFFDF